jgi:hypothetical protein
MYRAVQRTVHVVVTNHVWPYFQSRFPKPSFQTCFFLSQGDLKKVFLGTLDWGGKGGKGGGNEGVPKMVLAQLHIFLSSSKIKKDEKLSQKLSSISSFLIWLLVICEAEKICL